MSGTKYPNQIDSNTELVLSTDNVTPVASVVTNDLRGAILAVETTLGLVPSGVYSSVRARLDAMQTIINSLESGSGSPIGPVSGDLSGTLPSPNVIDLTITGQQKGNPSTDGYVLTTHSTGQNPSWTIGGVSLLSNLNPTNVDNTATSAGINSQASRSDHKHAINTASAISINSTNSQGSATTLSLSDHTHQVTGFSITGQTQGDVLYFNGSNWVRLAAGQDGYLLTTHSTGQNPSWTVGSPLTSSLPADVDKSSALLGVSGFGARSDHKHNILTASAISSGTTNAEGTATTLARSDHTHATTGLNITGQTQGDVLYFNGTSWVKLAAGQDGYYLTTHTSSSNPTWTKAPIVGTDLFISGEVQGDILYFNGTSWVRLPAGTIGQALITQDGGANPKWDSNFVAQNLSTTGFFNVGAPITINSVAANPNILQATSTSVSATGQTLSLLAQSMSGVNARGGNLVISSGTGTAASGLAPDGYVTINRGSQTVAKWQTGLVANSIIDDFIAIGKSPSTTGNFRVAQPFSFKGLGTGGSDQLLWDYGATVSNQLTIGTTGISLTINGSSPVNLNAGSGAYTFRATRLDFSTGITGIGSSGSLLLQALNSGTNDGSAANSVTLQAATNTGNNGRGGNLTLSSGSGTVASALAPDGYITINRGNNILAQWQTGLGTSTSLNDDFITIARKSLAATVGNVRLDGYCAVVARDSTNQVNRNLLLWRSDSLRVGNMGSPTSLIGTNISLVNETTDYQSMIGGIFIANDTTDPSGNPTAGIYEYCSAGTLTLRGSSGSVIVLGGP